MPTLALPVFADNTLADPVPVEQCFYNQTPTGTTSAEIINGHLDSDNRQAAWAVKKDHIQERALSGGGTVGGNVNLDYFGNVFTGYSRALETADAERAYSMYKAIPGGSVEYYLPYGCSIVILTWSIFVSSMVDLTPSTSTLAGLATTRQGRESEFDTRGGKIRLFSDGVPKTVQMMDVPVMMHTTPGGPNADGDMVGTFDRYWSGHLFLTQAGEVAQGWHRASLRIAGLSQDTTGGLNAVPNCQSRVRCRHMDYVYFL